MTRRTLVSVAAVLVGASILAAPAHASAASKASGDVAMTLADSFQAKIFKAGVFIYDANAVRVGMGSSGMLTITFPLTGTSTAKATTSITVDPETGGAEFYNGPAVTTVGLGNLVVTRTGTTGTVKGNIIGAYNASTGKQFSKSLTVFTMSSAQTTTSGKDWTLSADLTLTKDAANTLNSQLNTKVFKAGASFGSLSAEVNGS
jgi:hypothetical protein